MLRSSLCDYSEAYIIAKGTISIERVAASEPADNNDKEVVFKNCSPFTDYLSEINNTQINNAKNIDGIMSMYNILR